MGRNLWIKRLISVLCIAGIFSWGIYCCNKIVTKKDSIIKYKQFFESNKEFDVLFFGSSHVINSVSPLDLFHNYGITSYNLSMHANYIYSNYYLCKEVLESLKMSGRKLPRIVVLDIYGNVETAPALHRAWDSFPVSANKIEMANSLSEKADRLALIVPFFLYHNRWNELKKEDFRPAVNKIYGAEPRYGVAYPECEIITEPEDKIEPEPSKIEYLDKMEELCDSFGIQLVLIHIPYSYNPDLQRVGNGIGEYAEKREIIFENYMNREIGIDYDLDFSDTGHLNTVGMRIMTNELGRMLLENGVKDCRDEPEAEQWEREYEEYVQYRIMQLEEINEAKIYLMSINDPELVSQVWINKSVLEDKQMEGLVNRLKEKKDNITVIKEQIEILENDGKTQEYDIYCEIYKKSDLTVPVHTTGFFYKEVYEK